MVVVGQNGRRQGVVTVPSLSNRNECFHNFESLDWKKNWPALVHEKALQEKAAL